MTYCHEMDGSDLHLKTDVGKVFIRVHGELVDVDVPVFQERDFTAAMRELLRDQQIKRFEETMELDFALEVEGVSRFRGNLFRQRGTPQAIFRVIPFEIQTMDELHLPELCYELIERPRGLVLVTGPAGSGKSTTLASMIDAINRALPVHIVTVEDPVEFVHDDHVALINQREIDVDTNSFANALKYVLRQDPDVILVGEMRDLETIHLAITAAETGHLVFGTLHTVDALQTVDRIVDVFPQHQQQQIRMQLSVNLLGVISQTLIPRKDKRGRVAAFEVLNCTSAVRNLIRENKSYQISSIIQTGSKQKMHTLDQGLAKLVDRGIIDMNVAKSRAKDPGEFMRIVSLGVVTGTKQPSEPKTERHIFAHDPEVIHATTTPEEDKEAVAKAAEAAEAAREAEARAAELAAQQAAAASQQEPDLAAAVAGDIDGGYEELYADRGKETAPAAVEEEEEIDFRYVGPNGTMAKKPGMASHRVVPGGNAAYQSSGSNQDSFSSPTPATRPVTKTQVAYDPLDEGRAIKPIDPPTKPKVEKPKKKGFLAALFGGRD